ncbi:HDOD domain-containing protein [bacterium]|nr:HDOD domain-containing protein [bacterium]
MAEFHIETLNGGITQMVIDGRAGDEDQDLFRALSHLSQKHNQILINLSNLKEGLPSFFRCLQNISIRSRLKVISTDAAIITGCKEFELPTFPSLKSASLAYIGDETISMMLGKLKDVPILNTEAYRLISYISQPDAAFNKVESMIKDNPGICSQIFRMANSAYFKRSSTSETLQQALVSLGFATLRQLFLYNFYSSVGNIFQAQNEVIEHGKNCARLSEFIAKSAGCSSDECAKVRLGGLLHDVGAQALAFFFPYQYAEVMRKIKEESKPSYLAELLTFGTDHQTIGSMLCGKWNFPPYLGAVVGDHHYLKSTNWNALTLPIFCADNLLGEIHGLPFSKYYSKIEEYFSLKKKELPWKDFPAEAKKFLETPDPF